MSMDVLRILEEYGEWKAETLKKEYYFETAGIKRGY